MDWSKKPLVATLATVMLLVGLMSQEVVAKTSTKYLIFHLDAISSDLFVEEREAGNIPNIEAFFAEGTSILGGLSLWPGGTEMIYPRLKPGYSNEEYPFVGWRFLDAKGERWVLNYETMLKLFLDYPRRSRAFSLHAHPPYLDFLAGMSMKNIPFLLREYDVLEILWFSSDHAGHVSGREAQLASLYRFDRHFGKLIETTDLHDVNVILYADHGMTYPQDGSTVTDPKYLIPVNKMITALLGEKLYKAYYPNVYLHDPTIAPEVAQTLIDNVELDWAIYRSDDDTLVGLHPKGRAVWHGQDGKIAYRVQEGPDPFGYDQLGYAGEYLTKDEWLDLTIESRYPGAVANVWGLSRNANAGDVLVVINPPNVVFTMVTNTHNHKGLDRTDLLVPLLFRGPDLGHMAEVESMWLHELYSRHVPDIPFDKVPQREKHQISLNFPLDGSSLFDYGTLEGQFSPKYRVNLGGRWKQDHWDVFAQYDVFSSFLTRWWLGAGVRYDKQEESWCFTPLLEGQWQYGQWGVSLRLDHFQDQWNFEPGMCYYSSDWAWSLEVNTSGIGLRYYW